MWIDIVLLVFFVFGFYQGFRRGLIFTIFRVLALLLGVLFAIKFTPQGAAYLQTAIGLKSKTGLIFAFLGILSIVYVGVFLVGKMIDMLVKVVQLGLANRIAGGIVSIITYLFLFSALLKIIDALGIITPETRTESKAYPAFVAFAPLVTEGMGYVIPPMKNMFEDIKAQVDSL